MAKQKNIRKRETRRQKGRRTPSSYEARLCRLQILVAELLSQGNLKGAIRLARRLKKKAKHI